MAASSTAQVVFKGNTADLQKKLKVAEKGMQEFKDMGSDALSSIGDLFGVNTGKIGDMLGSVKKLSAGFQAMGSTGGTAFAGLSKGAAALAGGVAAIGIAGLVAGFKELNRQAEIFAQTDIGSDFVAINQAWRDTYNMAYTMSGSSGARWLKLREDAKNAGTRIGHVFGDSFAGVIQGDGLVNSVKEAFSKDQESFAAAMASIPYAEALEDAKDYMRDQSMSWAQQTAQVKEYERIARNTATSQVERENAISEAKKITAQRDQERIDALKNIYEAQRALNEQSETPEAGIEDLVNKYNAWQEAIGQAETNLSSLERLENRIDRSGGGGASAAAKEVDHLAEAIKSLHSSVEGAVNVNKVFGDTQDELKVSADAYQSALENIVSTYGTEDERIKALIDEYRKLAKARDDAANEMTRIETPTALASVTPVATKKGVAGQMQGIAGWKMPELTSEQKQYYEFLQGMVDATERANEAISAALVNGISNSIQYLADTLWGLEEFDGGALLRALISPLADACIQIGELVMATGFASDAFQKSITNPYAAIAAGAALIAVGAIAKAGMNAAVKNVGSGGGYSTSVASSAYTSNASNPSSFGREMQVKVTGTLTANGSQLVAVLNNEQNRNSYTT